MQVFIDEVKKTLNIGENILMECNSVIKSITTATGKVPLHESEMCTFYTNARKECQKVLKLLKNEISSSDAVMSNLDTTIHPSLKSHAKLVKQKCWNRKENRIKKSAAAKKKIES